MNQAVVGFFEELVATTTGTQEPELLSRIVTVWNRVLHMGSVRDSLFTQPSLCVNMASHLLQCCLCTSNSIMHDSMDELIEDMTIDPLVDPHMRSILSHICDYPRTTSSSISSNSMNTSSAGNNGNNGNNVLGAEEVNCIGILLIRDCQTLFSELVASSEVQQWLTSTVNQLHVQHISVIAGSNAASYRTSAVDLQLLVSLLPLLKIPSQQIITQLASLAAQLSESQFYNRGKEFAVLIATCCQMAGRLIQCNGIVTANRVDSQLVNDLQQLLCSTLVPVLSLGKKSFGRAAADVLNIAVDFAESISGLPGQNRLLTPAGLPLTKQLLDLTQVLAESTAAASPSVNQQASSTYRLLCFIAQGLNDDRVCAELLQPTLKAGVTAVHCYWQKTHKNLPFLASIAQNNPTGEVSGSAAGDNIPDIDGENVRPIAVLLTQLCVGSLSPTVSPQDTLTALEGLILLSEQHNLFAMNWFQNQCWASLLTPCLK
eukprot:gene16148-18434_t